MNKKRILEDVEKLLNMHKKGDYYEIYRTLL